MAKKDITLRTKEKIAHADAIGAISIDSNKLAEQIGMTIRLDDVSIDELREYYIKNKVVGILNNSGFFSVEYGSGIYVDIEKASPEVKASIISAQTGAVNKKIVAIADRVDAVQGVMNLDDNSVTVYFPIESIDSVENVIEQLKKNAI